MEITDTLKKECGSCTKCCEGWLKGNINGRKMYPGKPCHFIEIGKGCGIYPKRPEDPCKTFKCGWLDIEDMPEEFKPEKSGVIMHYKNLGELKYWTLLKAPNNPTVELLSWAVIYARSRNENIVWYINDKSWWLGDDMFCKKMIEEHKSV